MGRFEEVFTEGAGTMSTSSLSTNGYSIASKPAKLYSYIANNTAGTVRYIKIYNISGAVNMGTDAPFLRHAIPASASVSFTPKNAIPFDTGINVCGVSGPTDDGVGAVTAGDMHFFAQYA